MEIKPAYEHSKLGTFMFNLCAKWTKFIIKHRWLYYLLACTWGILMTLLGWILTLILFLFKLICWKGVSFKKYYWIYCVKVGPDYWGGCEMGLMFLRDWKSRDAYINPHEWGHSVQNSILGVLFPFLVAIPSATRYWLREIFPNKEWKPYDSAWFEDAATQCGEYMVNYLNK